MGIKKIINKSTLLYGLYSFCALLFFVWFLFPSDYIGGLIEKNVAAHGRGITLDVESVKPAFPVGVKLSGLTVEAPDFGVVPIDTVTARLSILSLIKFDPVLSLSTGLFGGTIKGKLSVPDGDFKNYTVDGIVVKGINLADVSGLFSSNLKGVSLTGTLDAEGSFVAAGRGQAKIDLTVRQLVVQPEKAILTLKNLSFKEITAKAEMKSKRIQIDNCEVDGNEFDGSIKGSVIVKYPYDKSVLRLSGTFRPEKEFAEKMPLNLVFKKKVDPGEEIPFKLSGTIKKPRFR